MAISFMLLPLYLLTMVATNIGRYCYRGDNQLLVNACCSVQSAISAAAGLGVRDLETWLLYSSVVTTYTHSLH